MTDFEPRPPVSKSADITASLRKVLIVLMLMGIPVIGILIYLNLQKAKSTSDNVKVVAP